MTNSVPFKIIKVLTNNVFASNNDFLILIRDFWLINTNDTFSILQCIRFSMNISITKYKHQICLLFRYWIRFLNNPQNSTPPTIMFHYFHLNSDFLLRRYLHNLFLIHIFFDFFHFLYTATKARNLGGMMMMLNAWSLSSYWEYREQRFMVHESYLLPFFHISL